MRRLIAFVLLAGCAGQLGNSLESEDVDAEEEAERPIGPAHGQENEQVEYEVKLRGVVVGRVQIAVGKRGLVDGRDAVVVSSSASGAGLADVFGTFRWTLTSTIDIDSGCSIREEEDTVVEIAGKREHAHSAFPTPYTACRRNVHAAAGALRGWHSHLGSKASLAVSFGPRTLDVELSDASREMITTVMGTTPARRYDGTSSMANSYPMSAWISDDAARVPLRMHTATKLGDVDVELVSYDVPREP